MRDYIHSSFFTPKIIYSYTCLCDLTEYIRLCDFIEYIHVSLTLQNMQMSLLCPYRIYRYTCHCTLTEYTGTHITVP